MLCGDGTDELLHHHSLPHAGAAEEANLAALQNRADQVDDFDTRLQNFRLGGLFRKPGCIAMEGILLLGFDWRHAVNGVSQNIGHASKRFRSHRHHDRLAGIFHRRPAPEAVRGTHGNRPDNSLLEVLLHLER